MRIETLQYEDLDTDSMEKYYSDCENEWNRDYMYPSGVGRANYFSSTFSNIISKQPAVLLGAYDNNNLICLMAVGRREWDSDHFNLNIGQVGPVCTAKDLAINRKCEAFIKLLEVAIEWSIKHKFGLLQRRIVCSQVQQIQYFEEAGFRMVDSLVTLTSLTKDTADDIYSNAQYQVRMAEKTDLTRLMNMTQTPFEHSRFINDRRLDDKKGIEVYTKWLETELTEYCSGEKSEITTSIHVATDNNNAVGYIVTKLDAVINKLFARSLASIELFVVDQQYQRSGIGGLLLEQVKQFYALQKIDLLEASTWPENKASLAAYQKHGFSVRELLFTYHCWLDQK